MHPSRRSVLSFSRLLQVLIPALFLAQSLPAQSTADSPSKEDVLVLSPFVVSSQGDDGYFAKNTLLGTRSTERLVNIPQNIQVINEEFLQDLNLDNGVDAFKYGASGINKREATSGDTFIRGFRVGGNSFLRNGVKFRGNMNIPLYDIDRIEIIKGPSALLFGLNASSGGVVNYVSKTSAEKPESHLKLTAASFNLYRAEASSSGPIGDGDFGYRVTVASTNADARRRFDYFKDAFVSVSVDHKLPNSSKLSLYYTYYYLDQLVSTETVDSQGRFLNIAPDFSAQEAWADAPRWTQYAYLSYINAISPTLQARFFLNGSEQNFNFHQIFSARVPDAAGNMNRTYQNYRGKERVLNVEADVLKTFETQSVSHKLTFGGGAKLQRTNQDFDNVVFAPINVYNPIYGTPRPGFNPGSAGPGGATSSATQRVFEASIYLQEQATMFKDRLILVGGYGWQGVNNFRKNNYANSTTDQIDRAFVKRYGAVFKPVGWASLYYNFSEAIAFNNSAFVGGPRNGQILDPSFTENSEFGVKAETSNGRLFGSVVFFDMNKTNVRLNYIQPDGTPGTGQEGRETNQGWEADIGLGFPNPVGRLQTILTYYSGDSKSISGAIPAGVTNKMWSALATQSFSNGTFKGLKFGGGLYYKDKFSLGNASGQSVAFIAPDYTTTTAFISFERSKYELSLNVDNLSDKKYVDGGDGAGAMNISLGRTIKFTARYRF